MSERAGTILDSIAQDLKAGLREVGGHFFNALVDTTTFVIEGLNKAGDFVADVRGNAGYILDGIYYENGEAIDGVVSVSNGIVKVGEDIVGTLINSTRFLTDAEYRENEGIPWLMQVVENNKKLLAHQMQKNSEHLEIIYRYSLGQELAEDQIKTATEQVAEMARLIPALALFQLPGGQVLLPTLAKLLPWHMVPEISTLEDAVAEAGEEGDEPESGQSPSSGPGEP